MKLVTKNYVCSYGVDLRELKSKPSVFKKEYSEEVMASAKSKREPKKSTNYATYFDFFLSTLMKRRCFVKKVSSTYTGS